MWFYKFIIVSYKNNGLQKDAVILKARKDKIGDKIEIVTDGKIAVRKNYEAFDSEIKEKLGWRE